MDLFQVRETTDPRVFRLVGELDLSSAHALLPVEQLTPGGDVGLDLAELKFVDGAGLDCLSRIAQHIDGSLVLSNPRLPIEKLIKRTASKDHLHNLVFNMKAPVVENTPAEDLPQNLDQTLVTEYSPESLCRWLVAAVCRERCGADFVGVTIWNEGQPDVAAFSHQLAADLDSAQIKSGEGPILDAVRKRQLSQSPSLLEERRWREFTNHALYSGVVCVAGIPLSTREESFGALSLYSEHENALGESGLGEVVRLAGQAACAIANSIHYWNVKELVRQLQEALESRAVIDQAKGILMAREGISAEEAFRTLRKASQRSNLKVRDLAQRVIDGVVHSGHVAGTDTATSLLAQ